MPFPPLCNTRRRAARELPDLARIPNGGGRRPPNAAPSSPRRGISAEKRRKRQITANISESDLGGPEPAGMPPHQGARRRTWGPCAVVKPGGRVPRPTSECRANGRAEAVFPPIIPGAGKTPSDATPPRRSPCPENTLIQEGKSQVAAEMRNSNSTCPKPTGAQAWLDARKNNPESARAGNQSAGGHFRRQKTARQSRTVTALYRNNPRQSETEYRHANLKRPSVSTRETTNGASASSLP